ncbi:hypothetical protein [Vreelandella glaciei]|uniref:hypothetical protein n=1 Tax=Vreelandella glaciei TaxID=186761 RepID=UPI00300243D4
MSRLSFSMTCFLTLFPAIGLAEVMQSPQEEPIQQDTQETVCHQINQTLDMPKGTALSMLAGSRDKARNVVNFYQCYGLFSIMQEYPSSDEIKSLATSLYQTEGKQITTLAVSINSGLSNIVLGPRLGIFTEGAMHDFIMRMHAAEIAYRNLDFYARSGSAEDIMELGALCFTAVEAIQEWKNNHSHDEKLVAKLQSSQLEADSQESINEQSAATLALANELFFGYPTPPEDAVSANKEIGINLSLPIKMSLMAWNADGRPHPALFTNDSFQKARMEISEMCN